MRYELIDNATGSSEIVDSFEELTHTVFLRYGEAALPIEMTRRNTPEYSFEVLPVRYKRKGDYSHRAVILSEHVHYWPETDREELMVLVRFEGGRNGDGVAILRADFDLFYEMEE